MNVLACISYDLQFQEVITGFPGEIVDMALY